MKSLATKFPIVQAPMAGGPGTPALAAAVSNAGGLGSLAIGYLTREKLREEIAEIRRLTKNPFAVNVFVHNDPALPSREAIRAMNQKLNHYRRELKLPEKEDYEPPPYSVEDHLVALLHEQPPIVSFTFGIPPADFLNACREKNILTIGTATHLEEGIALERAGVDMISAQGKEAGGHRGTFIGDPREKLVSTRTLVQQLVERTNLPVIAAGGIMTAEHVSELLSLGATAAQLGTAFLLCPEAGTSRPYREALKQKTGKTQITEAFSGRAARGIENRFLLEMRNEKSLPYPVQNSLTQDIRRASAQAGRSEFLSLWAGENYVDAQEKPAKQIVESLVN